MTREYVLRQQLQNRGAFASIRFDIINKLDEDRSLVFLYEADIKWKSACETGTLIFYDYFTRVKEGSLTVKIIEVKWLPVDTNHLTILYSVVKGLSELLNMPIKSLQLDNATETFNFPERRSLNLKTPGV